MLSLSEMKRHARDNYISKKPMVDLTVMQTVKNNVPHEKPPHEVHNSFNKANHKLLAQAKRKYNI